MTVSARSMAQPLKSGDDPAFRQFQEAQFGPGSRQADRASFRWRFEQHPHRDGDRPPVWICQRGDQVVGQQSALPLWLDAGGQSVSAMWAIDLMVDPAWRMRGVAPALNQAVYAAAPLLCGLNISEAAYKAFRRAGWLDLGTVPRMARLIRPLSAGHPPLGSLPATREMARASRVATPLLRAFDVLTLPWRCRGSRLQAIEHFDDRVDAVWRSAQPHYPVLARRDLSWLAWRFDAAPHAAIYQRHYLMRGDTVAGYAVTRRKGRSLLVADYLCPPHELGALFGHCLIQARRQGAVLLTCLAMPPDVRQRLRGLGFIGMRGPRLMIRPAEGATLPLALLRDRNAWYLTDGDSDMDHAG